MADIMPCQDCGPEHAVMIMLPELEAYQELRRLIWVEDDMDGAVRWIEHIGDLGYEGWGEPLA